MSSRDVDACLLLLEHALVQIRSACWSNEIDKAEALADAFHNLPRLLRETRHAWTVGGFEALVLDRLIAKYPEFSAMRDTLRENRNLG